MKRTGYIRNIPPRSSFFDQLTVITDTGRIICGSILLLVSIALIYTVVSEALDPARDAIKLIVSTAAMWTGYLILYPTTED